jgi:hypothetical protein
LNPGFAPYFFPPVRAPPNLAPPNFGFPDAGFDDFEKPEGFGFHPPVRLAGAPL